MTSKISGREAVEQLAEEFVDRYRRGELPSISEYCARLPEHAAEIRDLFPALVMMENIAPADSESRAGESFPAMPGPGEVFEQLGEYRILREVGRGGMGVVYEAEHVSLGRHVALKVLGSHAARSPQARERFRREARAAAKLHHSNIVPVFEVGEVDDVRFYAMQFIPGQSLDGVLAEVRRLRGMRDWSEQRLPETAAAGTLGEGAPPSSSPAPADETVIASLLLEGREAPPAPGAPLSAVVLPGKCELSSQSGAHPRHYYASVARIGIQVAEALAYAHDRGVIHRDIKPSNLLLDLTGTVWVTDFGLAKGDGEDLTRTGDIVGTLRYMAPERFRGNGDGRSDVYSLGATLYELATLTAVFQQSDHLQLIHQIANTDPPRPRNIDPRIPPDLETVLLKSIDRDAGRRYQSARHLADDLRCFLEDRPIQARRTGWLERTWRVCRRNQVVASLAATVALLVLAMAGIAGVAAYQRGLALNESELDRQDLLRLNDQIKVTNRDLVRATQVRDARFWLSLRDQARALRMSRQPGQRFDSLAVLREALRLPVPEGSSIDELRHEAIAALCLPDVEPVREWPGFPLGWSCLTVDDDFKLYARGDERGQISVRRIDDDEELFQLQVEGPVAGYGGLEFSPDGRYLHCQYGAGPNPNGRCWNIGGPAPRAVFDHDQRGFAFHPDNGQCAACGADGSLRVCDLASGALLWRMALPPEPTTRISWHAGSGRIAVIGGRNLKIFDDKSGDILLQRAFPEEFDFVAWRPDGQMLAASTRGGRIHYLDPAKGDVRRILDGRSAGVHFCFNHRGDRLLSNDWTQLMRIWDVSAGRELLTLPVRGTLLKTDRDDATLAADYSGGTIRLFRLNAGNEYRTVADPAGYERLVQIGQIGRLLAAQTGRGLQLVDLASGDAVAELPGYRTPLRFGQDDRELWTYGPYGLERWPITIDPADVAARRIGPPEVLLSWRAKETWGASRDGRWIGVPDRFNGAFLVDLVDQHRVPLGPQRDVRTCAVSPDGRFAATGSHWGGTDNGARVWDVQTGRLLRELPVADGCNVGFSPDGAWLITTGGGPRLWHTETWKPGPVPNYSLNNAFAFAPDSHLLALGGETIGVIHLIEVETGTEVLRLTGPDATRYAPLCFTPDMTTLVTQGGDTGALHIFDLRMIRDGLKPLGLDWDSPDFPPGGPVRPRERLKFSVDLGGQAGR